MMGSNTNPESVANNTIETTKVDPYITYIEGVIGDFKGGWESRISTEIYENRGIFARDKHTVEVKRELPDSFDPEDTGNEYTLTCINTNFSGDTYKSVDIILHHKNIADASNGLIRTESGLAIEFACLCLAFRPFFKRHIATIAMFADLQQKEGKPSERISLHISIGKKGVITESSWSTETKQEWQSEAGLAILNQLRAVFDKAIMYVPKDPSEVKENLPPDEA